MAKLNIGSVELPIAAATKTFAILAKRGAGKSYTAAVMAEEFFKARVPFVVFDPIDVWWGLRLDKNGKDAGLPVVVFGNEHADIPLTRDMGAKIAQAIVRDNVSCVISTFGMPKVAQRQLIADFADELLNINDTPRHVFIEEAHEFLPQRVFGAMGRVFASCEALVVMGRNRGIGVTLINQRAATINKDVLTQLDTLLAFRNVAPQDRKALKEWVEHHSAEGDFNKFMDSLPTLATGKGWIWSPEFMGIFKQISIRKRETFHPDREKLGLKFKMPEIAQNDIEAFIGKFASMKAPAAAKEEKGGKKRDVIVNAASPDTTKLQGQIRTLEDTIATQGIELGDLRKYKVMVDQIRKIVGGAAPAGSAMPAAVSSSALDMWRSRLGNGAARKILDFLAENNGQRFSKSQIGLATGLSMGASTIRVAIGKLIRTGIVKRENEQLFISPDL